jgi:predicted cupin superfamily sugar epimerase
MEVEGDIVLLRAAMKQCSAAFLSGAPLTIVGRSASQSSDFMVWGADGEGLFSGSSAEEAVAFALDAQYKSRMQDLIAKLELVPHPEGGFFREIYRSGAPPMTSRGRTDASGEVMVTPLGDRNQLTSMFWMANNDMPVLKMGVNVSMHIHYYNGGAPFRYYLIGADKVVKQVVLGPDPSSGHEQQMVVPSDTFKFGVLERPTAAFAKDTTRFVLVSEAVCPGFDFEDFNWVTADMLRNRVQGDEDLMKAFSVFLYDAPGDRGFDRFYAATTTTTTTTTATTTTGN